MKRMTWPSAEPESGALDLGPLVKAREYCRKVRDTMWRVRAEQMSETPGSCRRLLWCAFHAATRAEDSLAQASDRLAARACFPAVRGRALALKTECMEILEQAIILEREIRNGETEWMEVGEHAPARPTGTAPAA